MIPTFSDPILSEQISHMEEWPPKEATPAEIPGWLDPALVAKLGEQGVKQLYSHQREALDLWHEGSNVVVTTGTNSGKTLCYSLPAVHTCLQEPAARCLFIFPTKALAQDQLQRIRSLSPDDSIRAETYDGDTPKAHRGAIRQGTNVLITNPDMLHVGILPSHENWNRFFRALRLIAIDELHVYRGVFGSNVGCILRRLLRLCETYGSYPKIVSCSATIGNPTELFEKLTARKAKLVEKDGAPRGRRSFVFWNPPELKDNRRLSANLVTSEILSSLIEAEQRTLTFSRSRVSAELVLKYTRKRLVDHGSMPPGSVDSYRAGYTVKERRQIEKALFSGKLLGLSATNAMELGVDVGSLDAVIMNGYPGSVSSFWQQAGRAGRGSRDGIAIMVAHDDPLEQFLVRQPDLILVAGNESVALDPQNPRILSAHLLCAAYEKPLGVGELSDFGDKALDVAEDLDRKGELQFQTGRFYYPKFQPPAGLIDIRGSSSESVILEVDGIELGQMERWRAMMQAHEGAIYLHRGATFLVESLDLDEKRAILTPCTVDYYTQAVVQSVLDAEHPHRRKSMDDIEVSVCGVKVTDIVSEFMRKAVEGDSVLSTEPLDLPPQTYETVAVRFDLPPLKFDGDMATHIGSIHGTEHALLALAPLIAGCDRADLGSVWYPIFPETLRPAIFIFDRTPGGVGLAEKLFDSVGGWTKAAGQLLTTCDCDSGCPACLLSPRCECGNESLDKQGALHLLKRMS